MLAVTTKTALLIERCFIYAPSFFIPTIVREGISRGMAHLLFSRQGGDSGIENRIRGVFYSSVFKAKGLRIGRGVCFEGRNNIKIDNNVVLHGPLFISATGRAGKVSIGNLTHIDRYSVLYGQGGLNIGEKCAIASGVIIYSQTNQYDAYPELPVIEQGTRYSKVEIGNDVWIGAGAIILPGVTIGDHSVVGAGSVVTRDVEKASIVVGSPARLVKKREAIA